MEIKVKVCDRLLMHPYPYVIDMEARTKKIKAVVYEEIEEKEEDNERQTDI